MKWYTAIGCKMEDDEGRLLVKIGGRKRCSQRWKLCCGRPLPGASVRKIKFIPRCTVSYVLHLGKQHATEWADEEDFLFCLRRLKKRGLVAECDGESKEEALWLLLSKSVVVPVTDSFSERLGAFADDLALGKGLKIALRAFKRPVFTYEERMVLQQLAGGGYIPYHLAELTRQAGAVPCLWKNERSFRNRSCRNSCRSWFPYLRRNSL
ncbi:MAG: hypothetical protein ACLUPF_00620 [Dorea sp.]